jgi:site-specific recombinase XerD
LKKTNILTAIANIKLQATKYPYLYFNFGGARVSEVSDLRVRDINLNERLAKLRGKGSKERVVPLGKATCEILISYLNGVRPMPNSILKLNHAG